MPEMEDADRRVLGVLQHDSRVSVQELAGRTGLSASPAWRRVKRLEETGVITRHVALVDPAAVGLRVIAYVRVSLLDHTETSLTRFERFVQTADQIVECATITGTSDYQLKILARDPEALEHFVMRRLLSTGIVRATETSFVLRQTKYTTALPL